MEFSFPMRRQDILDNACDLVSLFEKNPFLQKKREARHFFFWTGFFALEAIDGDAEAF